MPESENPKFLDDLHGFTEADLPDEEELARRENVLDLMKALEEALIKPIYDPAAVARHEELKALCYDVPEPRPGETARDYDERIFGIVAESSTLSMLRNLGFWPR